MKKIQFDILTLFPDIIKPYLSDSILKRAQDKKLIKVNLYNWRDYATDKHKTVDDKPYGGGAGMLLKVEPIYKQLKAIKAIKHDRKTRVIMLAPDGKQFNHDEAVRLSTYKRLVLLSGRYEGFDARVEKFVDEKISIGPYVLSGGELASLVFVEAIARQLPGVLGHDEALKDETFSHGSEYGEYPQYTRPEAFEYNGKKLKVPKVLLSGDHKKVEEWKEKHARTSKKN